MSPPQVFVSYCHENARQKKELSSHLKVLANIELLDEWSDARVGSGEKWHEEIIAAIEHAELAILLITTEFFNSKYIMKEELPRILRRKSAGKLKLLPIIAEHCSWDLVLEIKELQVRPTDGKPVWARNRSDRKKALKEIVDEVAGMFPGDGPPPASPPETRWERTRFPDPTVRERRARYVVLAPRFQWVVLALTVVFLGFWMFSSYHTRRPDFPPLYYKELPGAPAGTSFKVTIRSPAHLSPNEVEIVEFGIKNMEGDSYQPWFELNSDGSIPSWRFTGGSHIPVDPLRSQDPAFWSKKELHAGLDLSQVKKYLGEPTGLSLGIRDHSHSLQRLPLRFATLPWIQTIKQCSFILSVLCFMYFLIIHTWRLKVYRMVN